MALLLRSPLTLPAPSPSAHLSFSISISFPPIEVKVLLRIKRRKDNLASYLDVAAAAEVIEARLLQPCAVVAVEVQELVENL